MKIKSILFFITTVFLFSACKKTPIIAPETPEEDINLGGATSVEGAFITLFQQPAANMTASELVQHRASDVAFGDKFVTAPSAVNSGLGPIFNQNSCENCHVGNGRSPFPTSNSDLRGLLIRLSANGTNSQGENLDLQGFGKQLQTKSVFGIQPEAQLSWTEIDQIVEMTEGENAHLRRFNFSINNSYIAFPSNAQMSPRIASPIIGLGLLEAVKETDIMALADPNDTNGDGISGKPNRVWDYVKNALSLGRFGWKAGQPTLFQQTAAAYNNDMGVTNPLFSVETCAGQPQADGLVDEPEIDMATLKAATFYSQSLGVPKRRNANNTTVKQGKILFLQLKCGSCHNPKFTTGQHEYAFLSNQTIYPYTDMLLHDMGAGLADNRPDFAATGNEWRTPPLWGIGLTQAVGGHTNFLHDGRARNLTEAILWHGGEAERSKTGFTQLTKSERASVIAFLESL